MASPLPAVFGLLALAGRLSCSGFEPEQGLTPTVQWPFFRHLDPPLTDWEQFAIGRKLRHPRGVYLPLVNDFRLFRCSS